MPSKCRIWRSRGTGAVLIALLLTAACKQAALEDPTHPNSTLPDKIVVGATLPLTGAEARIGGFYKEGYELAFEEASHKGGLLIGGRRVPVTLQLLDDESSPAKAVSLAERLINVEKVNLMLGTYSTSLVQPQSAVAEKYRVPYVNGGGAATEIDALDRRIHQADVAVGRVHGPARCHPIQVRAHGAGGGRRGSRNPAGRGGI